jgi:hypothetical protein
MEPLAEYGSKVGQETSQQVLVPVRLLKWLVMVANFGCLGIWYRVLKLNNLASALSKERILASREPLAEVAAFTFTTKFMNIPLELTGYPCAGNALQTDNLPYPSLMIIAIS